MARLANEAVLNVRPFALSRVAGCDRLAWDCQVTALRGWLAGVWRFVRDPAGVELVHRPERQLDEYRRHGYISGDCDDAAVLAAAMGKAIGFPAQFVVLGFYGSRSPFSHVYTELLVRPGRWVEFDVTRIPNRPSTTRRATWRV